MLPLLRVHVVGKEKGAITRRNNLGVDLVEGRDTITPSAQHPPLPSFNLNNDNEAQSGGCEPPGGPC